MAVVLVVEVGLVVLVEVALVDLFAFVVVVLGVVHLDFVPVELADHQDQEEEDYLVHQQRGEDWLLIQQQFVYQFL